MPEAAKCLLLFFDGVALLVPDQLADSVVESEPAVWEPLADQGLLHILSPESLVDQGVAESLAELFEGLLELGVIRNHGADEVVRNPPPSAVELLGGATTTGDRVTGLGFLSRGPLGLEADPTLMNDVIGRLQDRGLIGDRKNDHFGVEDSVEGLVLSTLSQLLRRPAEALGLALQPVSRQAGIVDALMYLLDRTASVTIGRLVMSDFEQVGVDLSSAPLEEVLAFRAEHGTAYRAYARDLRAFVRAVGELPRDEAAVALADRREALLDAAAALRELGRRTWRRSTAAFGLGVGGTALGLAMGNPIGAGLAFAGGLLGVQRRGDPGSAYTYLFSAYDEWSDAPTAGRSWVDLSRWIARQRTAPDDR